MNKKRRVVLTSILIVMIILMSIGTYSFFAADIFGNPTNNNLVQTTGSLQITYEDSQSINASNLNPGDYTNKTIKVKNTGTIDTTYELVWETITNNFIDQEELIYELTCTSNQTSCDDILERLGWYPRIKIL